MREAATLARYGTERNTLKRRVANGEAGVRASAGVSGGWAPACQRRPPRKAAATKSRKTNAIGLESILGRRRLGEGESGKENRGGLGGGRWRRFGRRRCLRWSRRSGRRRC